MLKTNVTIDEVLDLLNEACMLDLEAMNALVNARVDCNKELADHPTIQVRAFKDEGFQVGLIGILNGIFGISEDGVGAIAGMFDDDRNLISFKRIR